MRTLSILGCLLVFTAACGDADSNNPTNPGNPGTGGSEGGSGPGGSGGSGAQGGSAATGGSDGAAGSTGAAGGSVGGTGASAGASGSGGSGTTPNEYYVGENGSDQNPGTREEPFETLLKAHAVALPGTTIWVLPGTIPHSASVILAKLGNENSPIKIWAAPGERPVIDFAPQARGAARGIEIRGFYWHLKGLEIKNAADNAILISGSNNIVEDVVVHHNDDTGIQIMVSESQAGNDALGADNLVLNSDSFENWDEATAGENADGFAAKLRIGTGNVFRGCRAWNNADDGWDLFAADDIVRIEDSWSFLNGMTSRGSSPSGDGTGFKLGGRPNGPGQGGAPHVVTGSSAFENRSCGFSRNNNTDEPVLNQCGVGDNDDGDYCDLECASDFPVSISGSDAKSAQRDTNGSLPSIR